MDEDLEKVLMQDLLALSAADTHHDDEYGSTLQPPVRVTVAEEPHDYIAQPSTAPSTKHMSPRSPGRAAVKSSHQSIEDTWDKYLAAIQDSAAFASDVGRISRMQLHETDGIDHHELPRRAASDSILKHRGAAAIAARLATNALSADELAGVQFSSDVTPTYDIAANQPARNTTVSTTHSITPLSTSDAAGQAIPRGNVTPRLPRSPLLRPQSALPLSPMRPSDSQSPLTVTKPPSPLLPTWMVAPDSMVDALSHIRPPSPLPMRMITPDPMLDALSHTYGTAEFLEEARKLLALERHQLQHEFDSRRVEAVAEEERLEQERLKICAEVEQERKRRLAANERAKKLKDFRKRIGAATKVQAIARGYLTRKKHQVKARLAALRLEREATARKLKEEQEQQQRLMERLEQERRAREQSQLEEELQRENERQCAEAVRREEEERARQLAELEYQKGLQEQMRRDEHAKQIARQRAMETQERIQMSWEDSSSLRQRQQEELAARAARHAAEEERKRQLLELRRMAAEDMLSRSFREDARRQARLEADHCRRERQAMTLEDMHSRMIENARKMQEVEHRRQAEIAEQRAELQRREENLRAQAAVTSLPSEAQPSLATVSAWAPQQLSSGDAHTSDQQFVPQHERHRAATAPGDPAAATALAFQALWRGHHTRSSASNPVNVIKAHRLKQETIAATRIQAVWRGYRVRAAIFNALEAAKFDDDDDFDYAAVDVDDFLPKVDEGMFLDRAPAIRPNTTNKVPPQDLSSPSIPLPPISSTVSAAATSSHYSSSGLHPGNMDMPAQHPAYAQWYPMQPYPAYYPPMMPFGPPLHPYGQIPLHPPPQYAYAIPGQFPLPYQHPGAAEFPQRLTPLTVSQIGSRSTPASPERGMHSGRLDTAGSSRPGTKDSLAWELSSVRTGEYDRGSSASSPSPFGHHRQRDINPVDVWSQAGGITPSPTPPTSEPPTTAWGIRDPKTIELMLRRKRRMTSDPKVAADMDRKAGNQLQQGGRRPRYSTAMHTVQDDLPSSANGRRRDEVESDLISGTFSRPHPPATGAGPSQKALATATAAARKLRLLRRAMDAGVPLSFGFGSSAQALAPGPGRTTLRPSHSPLSPLSLARTSQVGEARYTTTVQKALSQTGSVNLPPLSISRYR